MRGCLHCVLICSLNALCKIVANLGTSAEGAKKITDKKRLFFLVHQFVLMRGILSSAFKTCIIWKFLHAGTQRIPTGELDFSRYL